MIFSIKTLAYVNTHLFPSSIHWHFYSPLIHYRASIQINALLILPKTLIPYHLSHLRRLENPARSHYQTVILQNLSDRVYLNRRWSQPLVLFPKRQRMPCLRTLVYLSLAHCDQTLNVRGRRTTYMRLIVIYYLSVIFWKFNVFVVIVVLRFEGRVGGVARGLGVVRGQVRF